MNRPLFRARNLDPSKRIRLFVDQHDDNNNDLTHSSTPSSSSSNLLVSHSSTSTCQTSQSATQLPQRSIPQMPFVSGMEREEEAEYHLQSALDAQQRLGSAKIRAVPIPDVYEDANSQSIYPAIVELPKQLIRLQPLQLESDEPDYDMDEIDRAWLTKSSRVECPTLTDLQYEMMIDRLENASTRTLVSLDEARILFTSPTPIVTDDGQMTHVYQFWHERRTTRNQRLKPRLLTERDVKEEKGKHHPYVAFRRRVEKMTTRKNRKNDEQAYLSMLKLRANFEAVVKLTNLIKQREANKASLLECALAVFQARCVSTAEDDTTPSTRVSSKSSTNHERHPRPHLKTSALMNSNSTPLTAQHQQLLAQLIRLKHQKKNQLLSKSSPLSHLLQSPFQSSANRSVPNEMTDPFEQKVKRFKASHRKSNQTDKLTQLLSSPTVPSSPTIHSMAGPTTPTSSQSIFERLSQGNVAHASSPQQTGRRRSKNSSPGTLKPGKSHRNLLSSDLLSLADSTPGGAVLLKAQLLEVARKLQQKEELENNSNHRVLLQDGSSVLSTTDESIQQRLDDGVMSVDDEEFTDPWQFRPKAGCRYLRPMDPERQQYVPTHRSSFSHVTCPERGHLGERRVRIGRGGRLLYDRHLDAENNDSMDQTSPFSSEKPVLWRVSSRPELGEAYRSHSHLQVHDHTTSLAHHLQSKSSSSIQLNDSFYHVNNHSSSLSSASGGKSWRPSSIELDHPYACSSTDIHRALRTLIEPRPPSPSSSPPPPALSSTPPMSTAQQIMLISTPPTPPPTSSTDLASQEQDQQPTGVFTKSSSTYVLSPSTSFFPGHHHSYVIPSSTPASLPAPPSKSSSCALVQFVQLHRMLPSTKTHSFASSTPVTTFDS